MKAETKEEKKEPFALPFLRGARKSTVVCAAAIALGLLLMGAAALANGGAEKKDRADTGTSDEAFNAYNAAYVQQTQEKLAAFLAKIDGAGSCDVLVTLESGVQYVYATEEKQQSDVAEKDAKNSSESSVTVIDAGDGEAPILLKRIEPTILGVVVVCDGAGDPSVREAVIETVTTLCGIGANRVSVTKKSQ